MKKLKSSNHTLLWLVLISCFNFSCSKVEWDIEPVILPFEQGEGLQLTEGANNTIWASWLSISADTAVNFQYSQFIDGEWSTPKVISKGNRYWHVNATATPKFATMGTPNNQMVASWLIRTSRYNAYDHHIFLSTSQENEGMWSPPFMPYQTNISAFYGLNTFVPLPNGELLMAWQDGRDTKYYIPTIKRFFPKPDSRIQLISAKINTDAKIVDEVLLDSTISQLCPFDGAMTDEGAVLVYRDHDVESNVKDIGIIRYVNGQWGQPQIIHQDNWVIKPPTVEGPTVDANGKQLAIAWYTKPKAVAKVQVAFSKDGGQSFSDAYQIEDAIPEGKVDVCLLENGNALVIWVEKNINNTNEQLLKLAEVNGKGKTIAVKQIAAFNEEAVQGAFPCIISQRENAIVSWKQEGFNYQCAYLSKH